MTLGRVPITNCELQLDDEAVRVAVGMRLGVSLCVPHKCRCGAEVDAQARHATVCRKAPGRIARHYALNDIVWRALNSAGVPSMKEPTGLCRQDGKRPDGLSLIPWQNGKLLVWDVTVVSTLADSYVAVAARESGLVAEQAAERKSVKYIDLQQNHFFQPIAVENLGALSTSAMEFLNVLGRRISSVSAVKTDNRHFFFSAFLSTLNASIVYFCAILLLTTIQSCSHSITGVFNFSF